MVYDVHIAILLCRDVYVVIKLNKKYNESWYTMCNFHLGHTFHFICRCLNVIYRTSFNFFECHSIIPKLKDSCLISDIQFAEFTFFLKFSDIGISLSSYFLIVTRHVIVQWGKVTRKPSSVRLCRFWFFAVCSCNKMLISKYWHNHISSNKVMLHLIFILRRQISHSVILYTR